MLTQAAVREAMTSSLRSPADLCERLGLKPSLEQYEVLTRFADGEHPMDIGGMDSAHATRAAGICALWRLLETPGSRVSVISSNPDLTTVLLSFLRTITTEVDPALASVCRWPRWNRLQIGDSTDYELHVYPNVPVCVAGIHETSHTVVILGAGSFDVAFSETREVLEGGMVGSGSRILRVW